MDDSFPFDSSFDSDSFPPERPSHASERAIDDLFNKAQKALNELNIPEDGSSSVVASEYDDLPEGWNEPDALPMTDTDRMYTLQEILQSVSADKGQQAVDWRSFENVEMDVNVVLGDTEMTMENVMRLKNGSVVPLDTQKNDPVTLQVNGQPIAKGEIMTRNGRFCIRITEIMSDKF